MEIVAAPLLPNDDYEVKWDESRTYENDIGLEVYEREIRIRPIGTEKWNTFAWTQSIGSVHLLNEYFESGQVWENIDEWYATHQV